MEHFRTHVKHKIGGRAKAMVVTDSRLHAVRYKQAFDKYIAEKGYTDVRTLVAFSGIVEDPDAPGKNLDGSRHEWRHQGKRTAGEVRQPRIPGAAGGGEVSDRIRSTAAAHDVCGQEAHRPARRADALAAESHLRGQGGHVHLGFPQQAGGNLQSFQALLRGHAHRTADGRAASLPAATPDRGDGPDLRGRGQGVLRGLFQTTPQGDGS